MKIMCPCCKAEFNFILSGHPVKLNIPVKMIIDSLSESSSISQASRKLGCSRGYIYHQLKLAGKLPKDYLKY
jgi:hypothetical protein